MKKWRIKYGWSTFYGRTFTVIDPDGIVCGQQSTIALACARIKQTLLLRAERAELKPAPGM